MSVPTRERARKYLPLVLLLLGFAVRLIGLDARSLWVDEAFSWWMSGHPPSELVRWCVRIDQHPPLYYLLLALWRGEFGESVWALRALSAFASTMTLALAFRWAARWGRTPALAFLVVLTLSPLHVRYAQEARMYAWLTLWIALALVDTPLPGRTSTPFGGTVGGLATAAALWTHNLALLFPVSVLGVWTVGCARRWSPCPPGRRVLSWALPLLLWVPWIPAWVHQAQGILPRFWVPFPRGWDVVATFHDLTLAFFPIPGVMALWALLAGGILLARTRRASDLALGLLLFIPLLAELAISWLRPIYLLRTFQWVLLPYGVLLGLAWFRVSPRALRWGLALLFLSFNVMALNAYRSAFVGEPWDRVARQVASRVHQGDVVLFNAGWVQLPFDYYFRRTGRVVEKHGIPVDFGQGRELEPLTQETDLARLQELLRDHPRAWLIYSHEWYTDPRHLTLKGLHAWGVLRETWTFPGIRVYVFERRPTSDRKGRFGGGVLAQNGERR